MDLENCYKPSQCRIHRNHSDLGTSTPGVSRPCDLDLYNTGDTHTDVHTDDLYLEEQHYWTWTSGAPGGRYPRALRDLYRHTNAKTVVLRSLLDPFGQHKSSTRSLSRSSNSVGSGSNSKVKGSRNSLTTRPLSPPRPSFICNHAPSVTAPPSMPVTPTAPPIEAPNAAPTHGHSLAREPKAYDYTSPAMAYMPTVEKTLQQASKPKTARTGASAVLTSLLCCVGARGGREGHKEGEKTNLG